jgi:hypothetical protein
MLGSSKQIKWAHEIRESKIEAIEEEFQPLDLFPIDRLTIIQKILEAQEDAVWWIDNRNVSSHSLMLWAAKQAERTPQKSKIIASDSDKIYPVSFLKPTISKPDQQIAPSWIAVIDHQQPISSHSEIINWRVVDNLGANPLEPTFYLSRQAEKTPPKQAQTLHRLLQQQDGGWAMRGWQFLTICRDENGKIEIEGIAGELIAPLSLIHELWQWRFENQE